MLLPRKSGVIAALVAFSLVAVACSDDAEPSAAPITTVAAETTTTSLAEVVETTSTTEAEVAESGVSTVSIEDASCAFDTPLEVTADCGWATVPQHWDDPSDPDTIRLHVATFTTAATPADATPVVYLEGGPGGDALGALSFTFADIFGPIADQHPLVIFTQRGSALSEIDLECEEIIDHELDVLESVPDPEVEQANALAAIEACMTRLREEGADPSAYHTVASAHDADAIREALGYDEWNVLGISYGTRLGQELARQHPEPIRALILDSIQPTDPRLGSLAALPTTFEGSLTQLFAGCEANTVCNATNPNLEDRLRAIVDQANAEPFEVTAIDQLSGDEYDAIVDGDRLLGSVFQALYSVEAFSAIPEMIGQLEEGNTDTLAALVGLQVTNGPFISNGMYIAVMCHDFLAELTPAEAWEAGASGDPFIDDSFASAAEDTQDLCEFVDGGSADASVTESVQSDVPTLLLAGEYDPITPPSFAAAVDPGFTTSQIAVLPHVGHGVVGNDCGLAIALAFLSDPALEADQSCISDVPEPFWVPASLEGVEFVAFDDTIAGVAGVRPVNWVDQRFGITVRDDSNLAHQTVLIQQGVPVASEQLVGLFGSQLGGEPVREGELTVADRTWEIWEIDSPQVLANMYVHEEGSFTMVVVVIAASGDDFDDVAAHVLPTVLAEIERS